MSSSRNMTPQVDLIDLISSDLGREWSQLHGLSSVFNKVVHWIVLLVFLGKVVVCNRAESSKAVLS